MRILFISSSITSAGNAQDLQTNVIVDSGTMQTIQRY